MKKITSLECKKCNSTDIKQISADTYQCNYCKSTFIVDDGTQNINININYSNTQNSQSNISSDINFKNLLVADFYIRIREDINKSGMFEKYSKEEINKANLISKVFMKFFQAPDMKEKFAKIADKVFSEVCQLKAMQQIINKRETFDNLKEKLFCKFEENGSLKDSDFLDEIDNRADCNEFFTQFAILVKKDRKISEWEHQAIFQLGEKFNIDSKKLKKYY